MINRIIIFGAGGDLTRRFLVPALAQLEQAGQLPDPLRIVGAARDARSDDEFVEICQESLRQHGPELSPQLWERFRRRLQWRQADATDPGDLRALLAESDQPSALYLALPPTVYAAVLDGLQKVGLPSGTRVVLEKPFGVDRGSAQELNQRLAALLPEESVFRVDHFLAKQTVQNILGLRFANRLFEPVWNHVHVREVEITWDETLGLEGRASYYDQAGALRDMLQNHLLQLLALVAMEPPVGLGERDLRDRKVDLLRATQALDTAAGGPSSVRARYTEGVAGGAQLPNYVDESGVDPDRKTETFAQATFTVDNWRWAGVPFVLRSGKALAADRSEVALHFRPVPHSAFPELERPPSNVLRLGLGPDRITAGLNLNDGGDPFALRSAELAVDLAPEDLPAYARLLLDILEGDPTLSIRGDEAEEAWRIVEPVLAAWQRDEVPLLTYPAGSTGPELPAADASR